MKFYDSEDGLFAIAGEFLAEGVLAGEPLVVIARGARHDAFTAALRDRGINDDALAGRLQLLDAHEMLRQFMAGTLPDESRFMQTIGGLVASTIKKHGALRAYGEMVDILWRDGNPEGAIRLEELWNDLAKRHTFSLFCAYPIGSFYRETDRGTFDAICERHSHVIPAENVDGAPAGDQARVIAQLQQRAAALETEIRQRKELE
ncbi:MAG TPA: MEDS domain-containing protein, partial [Thermoanaerobaculia bacterium]|nr:MEDS domain-containing protein [Thermoanaerobaculia bacterium]